MITVRVCVCVCFSMKPNQSFNSRGVCSRHILFTPIRALIEVNVQLVYFAHLVWRSSSGFWVGTPSKVRQKKKEKKDNIEKTNNHLFLYINIYMDQQQPLLKGTVLAPALVSLDYAKVRPGPSPRPPWRLSD